MGKKSPEGLTTLGLAVGKSMQYCLNQLTDSGRTSPLWVAASAGIGPELFKNREIKLSASKQLSE